MSIIYKKVIPIKNYRILEKSIVVINGSFSVL